ncbi:MAG TPA: transposase [Gemmatales bacterium]|nr:transposase [Gemmatales bacterium]
MPKITRFPPFGKRFFRLARKLIGACQFQHFWRMVLAVAGMQGRRSLQRIELLTDQQRSRQAIAHFLTRAEWDAPGLLWETALDALKQLGYRPGDTIYLLLDDTQKRKRGKQMDAVSKIFLHAEKVYAQGHTLLGAALVYRQAVIPCAVRLWASQARCQEGLKAAPGEPLKFRKLTELAATLIDEARQRLADAKRIVLFDAYYLCPAVTEACARTQSRYVGVAKKNRNFAPDGRPRDRRKLSRYGAGVLEREGRATMVRGKKHRLAERVGWLSKGGRVKLAFSRRPRETAWVALATNEPRWSAKTIVDHYLTRWGIEVLFKMSKQYLGLGDYQLLEYRGVVRYLHLVLIAYLLLTHLALAADAKACAERDKPLRLPSIPKLQETLRGKLWDDLIAHLESGRKTRLAARKIKQMIQR